MDRLRAALDVRTQVVEPVRVDDRGLRADGDENEVAVPRGEIVERGTHDELMSSDGRYADLYRLQTDELHRPAVVPAPGWALRIVLGEMSQEILASTRALPGVLDEAGFSFTHPDLEQAARWVVSQRPG